MTGGATQKVFAVVRDGGAGTPTTLAFTATDGCGPWSTFIGGGSTAWEIPVSGRVLNAADGQPLAGATVQVQGTNLTSTTGGDGRFTIVLVPKGLQTLVTTVRGFLADTRTVEMGGSAPPQIVRLQQPASEQVPTPVGSLVVVAPSGVVAGAGVTFDTVTAAGTTTLERVAPPTGAPPLPDGSQMGGEYYSIATTATTVGPAEVHLPYDPTALGVADPSQLRILRLENGVWVDRTTGVDLQARSVRASVSAVQPAGDQRAMGIPILNIWVLWKNLQQPVTQPSAPLQATPDSGRVIVFVPGILFDCGPPENWEQRLRLIEARS